MAVLKALLFVAAAIATTQLAAAQTAAERREALSRSIPKHEGYLGALAPDNIKKERPAGAVQSDGHLVPQAEPGI